MDDVRSISLFSRFTSSFAVMWTLGLVIVLIEATMIGPGVETLLSLSILFVWWVQRKVGGRLSVRDSASDVIEDRKSSNDNNARVVELISEMSDLVVKEIDGVRCGHEQTLQLISDAILKLNESFLGLNEKSSYQQVWLGNGYLWLEFHCWFL